MKLSPSEKRTLIYGVSFIALFSLFYWGIVPFIQEYQKISDTLERYKSSYQQVEAMARLETDYLARAEAYQGAYTELKSRYYANLDEKDALLRFLALVEEMTAKSGITIISKTTAANVENGYKALKVNLTLKGTSEQMTDLLMAYAGSPTTIRVDRLRIDRDQRNRVLQLKLTVSTLIIAEEGGAK